MMDKMEIVAREGHFERMKAGICGSAIAGSVYADVIGTLERMGDHCVNIAKSTIEYSTSTDQNVLDALAVMHADSEQ